MTLSDDAHRHPIALPGLSAADTRWLVAEARRVLAELGHDAAARADGVLQLPDSRILGLGNLARTISLLPRRRWRREVRAQVGALVALDPTKPVDPADLRPKLWSSQQAAGDFGYDLLEPLPGIVAMISAQGDGVTTVHQTLDQVGGDRDAAFDTALANLARLRLPRHTRRRVDTRVPSSWVEFLDSPDACGAARVLLLPEMFRRVLRREIPASGVLVAIPTKHELWIHVPVDQTVVATSLAMARLSFQTWAEEPYPISPDIFLVSPDMRAVTLIGADAYGIGIGHEAMTELVASLGAPRDEAS